MSRAYCPPDCPKEPASLSSEICRVEEMLHWTLPMALAWVLWRITQKVREACDEIGLGPPPSVFDVMNEAARVDESNAERPRLYFADGQCELWQRLRRGDLKARGIRPFTSAWSWIPASDWYEIDYFDAPDRNPKSVSVLGEEQPRFRDVSLPRRQLLTMWPASSLGRRDAKPKHDWQTVEDLFHMECMKRGGPPGLDMDADWSVQADAERFVLGVLIDRKESAAESVVRGRTKKMLERFANADGG